MEAKGETSDVRSESPDEEDYDSSDNDEDGDDRDEKNDVEGASPLNKSVCYYYGETGSECGSEAYAENSDEDLAGTKYETTERAFIKLRQAERVMAEKDENDKRWREEYGTDDGTDKSESDESSTVGLKQQSVNNTVVYAPNKQENVDEKSPVEEACQATENGDAIAEKQAAEPAPSEARSSRSSLKKKKQTRTNLLTPSRQNRQSDTNEISSLLKNASLEDSVARNRPRRAAKPVRRLVLEQN